MVDDLLCRFADRLFAEKPEWRKYVEPNLNGDLGLGITIPAPNPRLTAGLYIEIVDSEITIGTDWCHMHIWGETEDAIEQAMFLIKGFVDEEMVVLAYFKGDTWTGSQCVGLDDPWRPPGAGERRLVISWAGNLDSEIFGPISD